MNRFKYTRISPPDQMLTFEVRVQDRVIGFITKRKHNYCYGRTLDEVRGYTATRIEAADMLSELEAK